VRRFATILLSLGLFLGLTGARYLVAGDDPKKDETPKSEPAKSDAPKTEPAKDKEKETPKEATPKPDASAATETPPPIPPEVEAKLEAARRAVAEAIVAAQEAGLVKTSIEPPPILDILVTGRANDEATLKAKTGVSPEVFGAWFTGYGTTKDVVPQKDVRITQPGSGLKELYTQRANILNRHIDAVRKAHGGAPKEEAAKKDQPKEEAAKKDESNKDQPKEEAAKKDEPKKEDPKDDEAKKDKDGEKPPKDDAKKNDN
jgi:hypothetical protein